MQSLDTVLRLCGAGSGVPGDDFLSLRRKNNLACCRPLHAMESIDRSYCNCGRQQLQDDLGLEESAARFALLVCQRGKEGAVFSRGHRTARGRVEAARHVRDMMLTLIAVLATPECTTPSSHVLYVRVWHVRPLPSWACSSETANWVP